MLVHVLIHHFTPHPHALHLTHHSSPFLFTSLITPHPFLIPAFLHPPLSSFHTFYPPPLFPHSRSLSSSSFAPKNQTPTPAPEHRRALSYGASAYYIEMAMISLDAGHWCSYSPSGKSVVSRSRIMMVGTNIIAGNYSRVRYFSQVT